MDPLAGEWLHLVLRWVHILTGIAWIGQSFFFMWLDRSLAPRESAPGAGQGGVEGDLWMVHSGGFYLVEKKRVVPESLPPVLHWFKWEAGFTWLSGIFLLGVVYHMGGLMVDPQGKPLSAGMSNLVTLALLGAGWLVYDVLCRTPLAKRSQIFVPLLFGLGTGTAWGLAQVLSARAAYIHVGALLGTLMAGNVWMRIIPAQKDLVASLKERREASAGRAKEAKRRSVHNNYMTFPLVFVMISNHFPATTHGYHWLMLAAIALAGGVVRHAMNRPARANVAFAGAACGLVALAATYLSRAADRDSGGTPRRERPAPTREWKPDPGTAGTIRGVVRFSETPPARTPLSMRAEAHCAAKHGAGPLADDVLVEDSLVENAFVHVKEGLEDYIFEDPPEDAEVVFDQRDCLYRPRVLGTRAGQRVVFLNSDPVAHNVHIKSELNGGGWANRDMAGAGSRLERVFDQPEVMVALVCDRHPWMAAHLGVVEHPYFAVTDRDGRFEFANLVPGEYVLEIWHERLGTKSVAARLDPKGAIDVEVDLASR